MTKMKSKKMTKSTFAIIIMAIAMVAMLAFGGTYAYFTATATAQESGTVTLGTVKLTSSAATTFITDVTAMPGDTILEGGVTLSVDGSTATTGDWVAVKVTVGGTATANLITVDLGEDWEETSDGSGIYVYNTKVTDSVTVLADGFELQATDNWTQGEAASDEGIMGKTITLTVNAASIQGENVDLATAKTQLATKLGA
ncbi:MAG: hypothetical protein E7351_03750 [Clostridiales bacterium]|nr:hypothetical protein [Clostridiales bacterium]